MDMEDRYGFGKMDKGRRRGMNLALSRTLFGKRGKRPGESRERAGFRAARDS